MVYYTHKKKHRKIKRKLSAEEERERITHTLIRMYDMSLYPQNYVTEHIGGVFNKDICGIDRSGAAKLFIESGYALSWEKRGYVTEHGVEECRLRNNAVVRRAIKEFFLYHTDYDELMPINHFHLYTRYNKVTWIHEDGSEEDWTNLNSVDICHKILNIMRKKKMLNALEGEQQDDHLGYFVESGEE